MGKERITVWIDSGALSALRTRAVVDEASLSELVNAIVVERVQLAISPADGFEVVLPALNAGVHLAVQKSVDGLNSRLKHLLSKAMVSSLANRFAVFQLLASEFGEENARRIYDEATLEAEKRLEPILKRLALTLEGA